MRAVLVLLALPLLLLAGCRSPQMPSDTSRTSRRLETRPERLERATVGNDTRLVLREDGQRLALDAPAGATVELAFGVPDRSWHGVESVKLAAAFSNERGTQRLLERTLTAPPRDANGWTELVLPLDAVAGRSGTLELEARTPDGRPIGRWTNPALVAPGTPSPRTNLVLLSIDTLRADHLGAYGYGRPTSPAIDGMARQGVLFRNATAAASWTLPSHASMLTGLDPSRHGAVQFGFTTPIPPSVQTLAEQLWQAGYDTGAFTDGFFVSAALGFDQGFDRFRGPTRLESAARENLELALDWMKGRAGRPFFAFVHTYEVHMPYAPPPPFDEMFTSGYEGPYQRKFTYEDFVALEKAGGTRDPRLIEHLKGLYDGEIRHVDDAVGAFLRGLEDSGLARDTCVVLTSDHGEEFGEHGDLLHAKPKLYQELLHVPLIVWCPGRFAQPRVVDDLVGLVDIAPTLLDLAGAEPLTGIDGLSLRGALDGRPLDDGRSVLSQVDGSVDKRPGEVAALRRGRFKEIRSSVDDTDALFDLEADPGETRDASASATEARNDLGALLDAKLARPPVAASSPGPSPARPQEATGERLRALGYVVE
jgi:arylsulfatase A-like enzyme